MPVLSLKSTQKMRASFADVCQLSPQTTKYGFSVKRILMVGGIQTDDDDEYNYDGLQSSDRSYLEDAFKMLNGLGIPIDPNFEITTSNLREGEDFLKDDNPNAFDLVMFCYIYQGIGDGSDYGVIYCPETHHRTTWISPKAFLSGAWNNSALRTKATFLSVAYGNTEEEVMPRHFPDYKTVARKEGIIDTALMIRNNKHVEDYCTFSR